ncbi:MAG TPA: gliding motility-associated C-terminal domain-containing protein [Bacteroidia bacterium]|nr:gliding motility-associated C-terminal domain-containing protein [Bacteroidia bacterium]
MEYREDLEQLVKNTFDNFEADVNPDAWINIQNGLNVPPAANPDSIAGNVSTGAKLTAVSSKFIIMAVTAIIGVTTAVVYFSSDNTLDNTIADANPANESKTVQSYLPVSVSSDAENKNFSEAESAKKEEHTVPSFSSDEIVKNEEPQPSKDNSAYYSSANEDVVASMDKKNAENIQEEKNQGADEKLQNNLPPSTPPVSDEIKSGENSSAEDESSNQNNDEDVSTAAPLLKEEKNIEAYLGSIVNAITPNGDGKNDAFVIEGKNLKSLKVSIIDRSGKIIHQWNNLHGFWDGKLQNGEPAKAGTYIYDIFAQTNSGSPISKSGTIYLLLK